MEDKEEQPLTRKGKKINYVSDSESSVDSIPAVKIPEKVKKPRSEAQINAFKKTQENRSKNIALNKENKKLEAAKLLMSQPVKSVVKSVAKPDPESSSEEEVIIVEKRKKKSKTKRIIVEESESEEEEEPAKPVHKEKAFKSQQNKRSINVNVQTPTPSTTVFFV